MLDPETTKDAVIRGEMRPASDVERSWIRSAEALGSPWGSLQVPSTSLSSVDCTLLDLLKGPLGHLSQTLDDSETVFQLVNAEGWLLHCWIPDDRSRRRMEQASTGPGSFVAESAIGTNAAGTALASGKSLLVKGHEHFADVYRNSVCAAAPLRVQGDDQVHGVVVLGAIDRPGAHLLLPMVRMIAAHARAYLASRPSAALRLRQTAMEQPRTVIQQLEIDAIRGALANANGLRESAAHQLGWSRSTLYRKMRSYGIEVG